LDGQSALKLARVSGRPSTPFRTQPLPTCRSRLGPTTHAQHPTRIEGMHQHAEVFCSAKSGLVALASSARKHVCCPDKNQALANQVAIRSIDAHWLDGDLQRRFLQRSDGRREPHDGPALAKLRVVPSRRASVCALWWQSIQDFPASPRSRELPA